MEIFIRSFDVLINNWMKQSWVSCGDNDNDEYYNDDNEQAQRNSALMLIAINLAGIQN